MIDRVEVFVELLNEDVPVWRPTAAFRLDHDILVLSNENHDAETEEWAVPPGSLIEIAFRKSHEGLIPVAVKYDEPKQ